MTLLQNARLVGSASPEPQSLRIDASGIIQDIGPLVSIPREESIDLEGAFLCPGLWDTHIHLSLYALSLTQLDLSNCSSRSRCLDLIAERAKTSKEVWIQGFGWAESDWSDDPRRPTREELDRLSNGKPLFLSRSDLHSAVVNSAALRLAGINEESSDPPGGAYERGEDGRLSGHLLDMAQQEIQKVIPRLEQGVFDAALLEAVARLHRWGIVGVCDQRIKDHPDGPVAREMYRRLAPRLRIHCNLAAHEIGPELANPSFASGNEWLRVGHVKFFSDGSLGSRTARLKQPYLGSEETGLWLTTPAQMREGFALARSAGYPISVHAIGDEAISVVLDIFQELPKHPLDRIEHMQILSPEDLPRVAQWGGVASMQPVHLLDDRYLAERLLGERAAGYYRLQSMYQAGVRLSFGSDAPVATADPWLGLKAAILRYRSVSEEPWFAQECLAPEVALAAYTSQASAGLGWTQTGRLERNCWADLAVLDRDPLQVEDPCDVKVLRTIVGGETVYVAR